MGYGNPMTCFNLEDNTVVGAADYFRNRAFQLLADGYRWLGYCSPLTWKGVTWGVITQYQDEEGFPYHSIYVLKSHRGQGHMKRALKHMNGHGAVFVTVGPCNVFDYLEKHVEVVLAGDHLVWPEYRKIEAFYGDSKAERSGLFKMNHIDEGVAVLKRLGADRIAQAAFMLHPLVQRDDDLKSNYPRLSPDPIYTGPADWSSAPDNEDEIPEPSALVLAMEYRNIANQFLSPMENHPGYDDPEAIALSPLFDVNQMLVADKIQNRKDFLAHHKGTHPRSEWLNAYFIRWLKRLGVSDEEYERMVDFITIPKATIVDSIER